MTYEEAIAATVTRKEALAEVAKHHIDAAEFLADMGDAAEYSGEAVLAWLGY